MVTSRELKQRHMNKYLKLKGKKLTLEQCIWCLKKDMFQLYVDAKRKEDFAILATTNSFKETINKKKEPIVDLDTNNLGEECKSVISCVNKSS